MVLQPKCPCPRAVWPPTLYVNRFNASGRMNASVSLHWDDSEHEWALCPYTWGTSDRARQAALTLARSEPLDAQLDRLAPLVLGDALRVLEAEIGDLEDQINDLYEERRLLECRKAVQEIPGTDAVKRVALGLLGSWSGTAPELITAAQAIVAPVGISATPD